MSDRQRWIHDPSRTDGNVRRLVYRSSSLTYLSRQNSTLVWPSFASEWRDHDGLCSSIIALSDDTVDLMRSNCCNPTTQKSASDTWSHLGSCDMEPLLTWSYIPANDALR